MRSTPRAPRVTMYWHAMHVPAVCVLHVAQRGAAVVIAELLWIEYADAAVSVMSSVAGASALPAALAQLHSLAGLAPSMPRMLAPSHHRRISFLDAEHVAAWISKLSLASDPASLAQREVYAHNLLAMMTSGTYLHAYTFRG